VFTGIIEALGAVTLFDGGNLALDVVGSLGDDPIRLGESIAVNGCCLTVVETSPALLFNLSPETLARTSLGDLAPGKNVNLERAMRVGDRLGGHLVQGHVDGTGSVVSITPSDGATVIRFRVPESGAKYVIDKGSIALDGISLTVVEPKGLEFDTWIIPHTLANTNLGNRRAGDAINVEFDVIARYAERLLSAKLDAHEG
jgi:riboflavin synthase